MIDMMLLASSTLHNSYPNEPPMKLIASPWSPPAWMKAPTNDDDENATHAMKMTGSAEPVCLKDGTGVDSRYAKSWALYFTKWLDACELSVARIAYLLGCRSTFNCYVGTN